MILSWCRMQAGNDGRRPSGVVWTRGKAHLIKEGGLIDTAVCGSKVNMFPKTEAEVTCKRCLIWMKKNRPEMLGNA